MDEPAPVYETTDVCRPACEPADKLAPAYELASAYEPVLKAKQDVHVVDVHLARVCGVADPSKEFWMGPIKC